MRYNFLCILILLFITSCSHNSGWKTIKYSSSKDEMKNYYLDLHRELGMKSYKTPIYHGSPQLEFKDNDGSIIYILDDVTDGSFLNFKNRSEMGILAYKYRNPNLDTVDTRGTQEDGKYWREAILGKIVVGYLNVSKEKLALYDSIISTLRVKE